MAEWLELHELAAALGLEALAVREELAGHALADGSMPSEIALAHGLGRIERGSRSARVGVWHADCVAILGGPRTSEVQEPLFGLDLPCEDCEDAAGAGVADEPGAAAEDVVVAASEPAGLGAKGASPVGDSSGSGPVGRIAPGYEAIVATDGSCKGNPGPGGWAWVEQISGVRASGGAASTTNNIMELTAMIRALEYVGPEASLLIRADSQYVINVMTKWAAGWRRKGWKKADGQPVKNRDLVERLLSLYEGRSGLTDVEWVKGHAGDAANELVDSLAVKESTARA